jgi:DNA-binding SARP family transcriptional activator/tetratricopeptide (TPR) repeat protein
MKIVDPPVSTSGALAFGALGSLEVAVGGFRVALAPRQEIVLALLLLEAGNVVSVGRMVDALWSDDPPRTARSQVHITISALRRIVGEGVIVTRPPGYSINVPDGSLDLTRFGDLVAGGVSLTAQQRIPQAVQCLRAALDLWRGPAMEGLASPAIQAAATRLNERRLSVLQDCMDLEFQLGRHSGVVAELAEMVANNPLNERFRAQLMMALYRTGRQSDALEVFRAGREILQEDLGIDPGQELCDLERAILAHDTQITSPPDEVTGLPAEDVNLPIPRQLPRTSADFVGREEILSEISGILSGAADANARPEVPVVVLTGRPGTGKTALAVRVGHLVYTAFPDGHLFLQLGSGEQRTMSGLLEDVLRSIGIRSDIMPIDLSGLSAMYRSWLANRRVLIVIDGARSHHQLMHLLPGTSGCAAIVTTDRRFARLEGACHLEVGPLDEPSAHRLLEGMVGASRVRAEQEAARELVRLCEGLPLALRIVAGKLVARPHWQIGRMARQLRDEQRRLDALDLDGVSVRATLTLVYEGLGENARRLLRRLSLFNAESFPSWVSAPLLDLDIDSADELLQMLVRSHLVDIRVTADGAARFHLHDLVRIYAAERLLEEEPAAERASSVRRLLSCWLFIATMAHRRIYGGDFGVLHGHAERWPLSADMVEVLLEDPAEWFRRERAALMVAIEKAAQSGLDELCWDLAVTTATLFESGSYSDDWRESHASALTTVRSAGNRRGEAALLYSLGSLETAVNLTAAGGYFEQALSTFEEISDDQGQALALVGLAFIERHRGRYELALPRYQSAVEWFRAAEDRAGEAYTLKTMAQIHADWRDFDTSQRLLDRARSICAELGSIRLAAQVEYEVGELELRRGDLHAAARAFVTVLQQTLHNGDVIGQAYALAGLGNARRLIGDLAAAQSALDEAHELTRGLDDRLIHGRVLVAMAELDYAKGQFERALRRAVEATEVLGKLGSATLWHARALEVLGRLYEQGDQADLAEQAWQSALEQVTGADTALVSRLTAELARLRPGGPADVPPADRPL